MDHKERFLATISNAPVDRPASWLGLPVPAAEPALLKHFKVKSVDELKQVIDDLINLGTDIIHPIQALAEDMDAPNLKKHFAGKTAFCGGVDAQYLLVKGTPDKVSDKVKELVELFPTGLIISPSHEAILPDIPPANIEALFSTLKTN